MKAHAPTQAMRIALLSASALAAGLLLYLGAAVLEHGLGLEGASAVCAEEALKTCIIVIGSILGSRIGPRRGAGLMAGKGARCGLLWGLAAIAAFAAIENLAYFLAFPGGGIFLRLLWAEPVHIVTGLAEASAVGMATQLRGAAVRRGPSARRGARGRPAALGFTAALLLAAAFSWHLAFNLAAGGDAGIAAKPGPMALAVAANAVALIAFGRLFARRILIGGFLYGQR
jgi:hypothetical protein